MNVSLPLDRMTTADKLEVMERLWADLSRDEAHLESPPWHEQVLRKRDEALREGRETPLDWAIAKKRLRDLGA